MKIFSRFAVTVFVTASIPLAVWAQASSVRDGIYSVQGTNTSFGEYSGKVWIHGSQVQRLIHFKTFRQQDLEVESIWSGVAQGQEFDFSLKRSNVLTAFNGYTPTDDEIKNSMKIALSAAEVGQAMSFTVQDEGTYNETWQRQGDASEKPLWMDLRTSVVGLGDEGSKLIKIARWAGLDAVMDWYRNLPESQVYKDRVEFQQGKQIFISDKTDADFYAKNKTTLRITNKTVNPLSLAEAMMRRNAYGKTLAQKAEYLGKQTTSENLNAAGILEISVLDQNGNKVGRATEYDSALWTSLYGLSEVMRYQATKDPQALHNFRRVLDGILTLTEITNSQTEFARSLAVSPPEENLGDGWIQGTGKFANLKWRAGGNNDMAKGLFITLALAHKYVHPSETALIARIQRAVQALTGFQAIRERAFNNGIAHGLVALWNKDQSELNVFTQSMINGIEQIGDATKLDVGFYVGGVADWSGINLTMTSNLAQIFVSEELLKVFTTNDTSHYLIATSLKQSQSKLKEMHDVYKEAHRDFLTVMAYAFSPQAREDKTFKAEARQALWTLREIPAPRNIGSGSVDLSKIPEWSLSSWPRVPWKALAGFKKVKSDRTFLDHAQGVYSYPNFETLAWSTTFLWKDSPFYLTFQGNGQTRSFSSDYLMVYWSARAAGLISDKE